MLRILILLATLLALPVPAATHKAQTQLASVPRARRTGRSSDSILPNAHRVHRYNEFDWVEWLNSRELLLAYGDKARDFEFYRLDIKTHRTRPIRELNRTFLIWNHDHFALSPNGRYAAWREPSDHLVVVSTDGINFVQRWRDPSDEHNPIIWMTDSQHFFTMGRGVHLDEPDWTLDMFDIKRPRWTRTVKVKRKLMDWDVTPTPQGTLLCLLGGSSEKDVASVRINEVKLSPRPTLVRTITIDLKDKGLFHFCKIAPTGKAISWTLASSSAKRGSSVRTFWLSSLEGREWRKIGSLDVVNTSPDDDEDCLNWIPGGRSLWIDRNRTIWRIPLGADRRRPAQRGAKATPLPQIGAKGEVPDRAALNSQLFDAIENGNSGTIRDLLRQGASVRARDKQGWTPLLLAASKDNREMCGIFLAAGADVNARSNEGETPLWAAAGGGSMALVSLLLRHHAKVNIRTKYHSSALQFAAEMGFLNVVKLLVDHRADLRTQGEGAIDQAVFRGRTEVVQYLIRHGVSINHQRWSTGSYPKDVDTGWSLLMIALKRGHTDIAELLVKQGADVSVKSKKGMTALKLARSDGDEEIVRMLKHAGATE